MKQPGKQIDKHMYPGLTVNEYGFRFCLIHFETQIKYKEIISRNYYLNILVLCYSVLSSKYTYYTIRHELIGFT